MDRAARNRSAPAEAEQARNAKFAANLRYLMAERRITTRDLGSAIGSSHQAISRWLTLQNGPSRRRLAQVSEFFGVSAQRLLSSPDPDREPDEPFDRETTIWEVYPKRTDSGFEFEVREPGFDTRNRSQWNIPASALADAVGRSNAAVIRFTGHGLAPDIHAGDYIFADIDCRTVSTPGIYLLTIASLPTWRRCEPLIGENVLVYHEACTQELPAKDLPVRARAIAVHHKLPSG